MRPMQEFSREERARIRYVLADIDDTLTLDGRLRPEAFQALADLEEAGYRVAPITGRPAGWCDHIARMWPVCAVVGENGAFFFAYDRSTQRMIRRYWFPPSRRQADRARLDRLGRQILAAIPGAALAADQTYRDSDLAIDFREDVPPLPLAEVDRIVALFHQAGAQAKISSIHVNGWFGDFDKLAMTRILFQERFTVDLEAVKDQVVFVGDSPNDAPMFRFFPHAVGVANVADFAGRLPAEPAWITAERGGAGFAEAARHLLAAGGDG